jgi:hypothetical protein
MIPVEERAAIRHAYYIEHQTIRQIARERDVAPDRAQSAGGGRGAALPRPAPILGPFKAQLDAFLAENERLPYKQRYTSHRMFILIQATGYRGSESHIRAYIGQQRRARQRPAIFMPLEFDPGHPPSCSWSGDRDTSSPATPFHGPALWQPPPPVESRQVRRLRPMLISLEYIAGGALGVKKRASIEDPNWIRRGALCLMFNLRVKDHLSAVPLASGCLQVSMALC